MNKLTLASRLGLGLIFFVFGLNGFFNFLPQPPLPEQAMGFLGGLASSGYFFPFMKATEVICGALLLANFFAPLALVILAPITINIFLFHAILTPGLQNLVLPLVLVAASLVLAIAWKDKYSALLQAK